LPFALGIHCHEYPDDAFRAGSIWGIPVPILSIPPACTAHFKFCLCALSGVVRCTYRNEDQRCQLFQHLFFYSPFLSGVVFPLFFFFNWISPPFQPLPHLNLLLCLLLGTPHPSLRLHRTYCLPCRADVVFLIALFVFPSGSVPLAMLSSFVILLLPCSLDRLPLSALIDES